VDSLINVALRYRDRIDPATFAPQVSWRSPRNRRRILNDDQLLMGESLVQKAL
jgi:UDP-sulfoquinovose synthase